MSTNHKDLMQQIDQLEKKIKEQDRYKNSRNDGRGLYIACSILMALEMVYLKTATSSVIGVPVMLGHAVHRNHTINGAKK